MNENYQTSIFDLLEIEEFTADDQSILEKNNFEKVKKQTSLFANDEIEESWKIEWQGMPEFIQNDQEPIQQIIVSFKTKEDIKIFAELINQNVTYQTKSVWYPEEKKGKFKNYHYE